MSKSTLMKTRAPSFMIHVGLSTRGMKERLSGRNGPDWDTIESINLQLTQSEWSMQQLQKKVQLVNAGQMTRQKVETTFRAKAQALNKRILYWASTVVSVCITLGVVQMK